MFLARWCFSLSDRFYFLVFMLYLMMTLPFFVSAEDGGISIGQTRVIYTLGTKSESVSISNSSSSSRFLIQSWIDDAADNKTIDLITTPPIYNSAPGDKNYLKIINTRQIGLPDREQLYYLNVKSIPVFDKKDIEGRNVMVVSTNTRIKLFVRPKGLKIPPSEAPYHLIFHRVERQLIIKNPTPYYLTLTDIRTTGKELDGVMVAPFNHAQLPLPAGNENIVSYKVINDYGSSSEAIKVTIK